MHQESPDCCFVVLFERKQMKKTPKCSYIEGLFRRYNKHQERVCIERQQFCFHVKLGRHRCVYIGRWLADYDDTK